MYMRYSLISGLNESVLIIATPQASSGVSWERGQELLPGALAAVDHINYGHSGSSKLTLLIASIAVELGHHQESFADIIKTVHHLMSMLLC